MSDIIKCFDCCDHYCKECSTIFKCLNCTEIICHFCVNNHLEKCNGDGYDLYENYEVLK